MTTAATLTAALTLGVSLGTWHRRWERVARPCFPWSGGAGSGGGASEPLGSFSGCRKNWKARLFLATSSDFFLSFSLKKKKSQRGFLVGQPETQWGHRLIQGSGGWGGLGTLASDKGEPSARGGLETRAALRLLPGPCAPCWWRLFRWPEAGLGRAGMRSGCPQFQRWVQSPRVPAGGRGLSAVTCCSCAPGGPVARPAESQSRPEPRPCPSRWGRAPSSTPGCWTS